MIGKEEDESHSYSLIFYLFEKTLLFSHYSTTLAAFSIFQFNIPIRIQTKILNEEITK